LSFIAKLKTNYKRHESRAIAGRTMWCCCKCQYVSDREEWEKREGRGERRAREVVHNLRETTPPRYQMAGYGPVLCVQNLKFIALPVPEIIGSTQEICAVPGYAHTVFFQIFNGLLLGWTLWMYLPNFKFVALPVPEIIGYSKKLGSRSLHIRPCSVFSKILMDLFSWTLWMYRPNLKSVALFVPGTTL